MVRTSTRQTIYLPIPGLVDVETLEPGDLVGTNKDSYLILEKLPSEFDSRVSAAAHVGRLHFAMGSDLEHCLSHTYALFSRHR